MSQPTDAQSLLSVLGRRPRPAGSEAEAEARAVCAAWLTGAGFEVSERPFEYSTFPGRMGTPLAGVCLCGMALWAAIRISRHHDDAVIVMIAALSGLVAVCVAAWWTGRYGTRLVPIMRRRGVNLEARRGTPAVWLVAHLDSKSQPVSLLVRAVAASLIACGWILASVCWGLGRILGLDPGAEVVFLFAAAIASIPLVLSWVQQDGDGTLDNASGVVSILGAAKQIASGPVGVLITSAEELGLAGARAWVHGRSAAVAINCDGVDDTGTVTVTTGGNGRRFWKRLSSGQSTDAAVRLRRMLPGVLMDSTAFSDQGWDACTVSRGTLDSLARIHTSGDTLTRLTGKGIEGVQDLITSMAAAVIADGKTPETENRGLDG